MDTSKKMNEGNPPSITLHQYLQSYNLYTSARIKENKARTQAFMEALHLERKENRGADMVVSSEYKKFNEGIIKKITTDKNNKNE